jgi:hypothetical protein
MEMTQAPPDPKGLALRGHAVEHAAVAWILDYEHALGRVPIDRRYEKAFAGDIQSPPRIIEVKATSTTYRGWFIPLESVQLEHARHDPDFYLYVVENVGQGDPKHFTLRIIGGEVLRELAAKAVERRYFEMSWPTKVYDSIVPIRWSSVDGVSDSSSAESPTVSAPELVASLSRSATAAAAIQEALEAIGGEGSVAEVTAWINKRYPGRWKDITVAMADLTYPGNKSSRYAIDRRFLDRVAPGRYRLRR